MKKFVVTKIIKHDVLGSIEIGNFINNDQTIPAIRRVYSTAKWWARPIAKFLAYNEKKALQQLQSLNKKPNPPVPQLLHAGKGYIVRSFIPSTPMYKKPPQTITYYQQAKTLLRKMRKLGVCNNDLAKESNWMVGEDGSPILIDFQLAIRCKKNRKLLRLCSREDLRHLLKHQRKYCSKTLTTKEQQILQTKALPNRLWKKTGRRLYRWYTRKVLGWKSRKGPHDRGNLD